MADTVGAGFDDQLHALDIAGGIGLGMLSDTDVRGIISDIETLRENPDSVLDWELPSRWQLALLAVCLAAFVTVFVR